VTVGLDHLPGRQLDRNELIELARSIAAHPELWEGLIAFDDEHRHYVSLHRDAHVDVWVLCWTPSNDTGWHDHDISSGAVAVVRGAVVEHNLALGTDCLRTTVAAGLSFSFGPDHIHRMTGEEHEGGRGSVTIHAYSPPLWRMGQYSISTTGVLRRASVSYADELRPIDEPFPADQARLRDSLL
jgi:Cysteine dioxygenase type I